MPKLLRQLGLEFSRPTMRTLKSLLKLSRGWYNYSVLLILTVVLVLFYVIQMTYLNSFINMRYGRKREFDDTQDNEFSLLPNFHFEGEQLVHFDLKGAPPKISYLLKFLPFIKNLGATGILMEYEDTFPYQGEIEDIKAGNAYTPSDIAAIVKTAQKHNLSVIPLVPTFSHFEFVLKLQKYKRFRETEDHAHVLCPSQAQIYPILYQMIDQVLAAHPTSTYLHIGSDEAYFIGMCPKCQQLMKQNKWRKDDIYFVHVKRIAEYINKKYPKIRPILWADKFLKENEKTILRHKIPDIADIMLWNYQPEKQSFPRVDDMNSYVRLFKNIWIAGAYKGATGRTKYVTDPDYHFRNLRQWMNFVQEWKSRIPFKGVTLTGWQRYSHFAVLCELLPVGIPSLVLELQYLNKKNGADSGEMKQALGCNDFVPLNLEDVKDLALMKRLKCDFPGYRVYKTIFAFYNAMRHMQTLLSDLRHGDMTFFSVIHNSSNSEYVQKISLRSFRNKLNEFTEMEKEIRAALSEVYDHYTVDEWVLTFVTPPRMRLEATINILSALKKKKVWPRRPFPDLSSRVKQFFNKTCGETETLGCTLFTIH